MYYFVETPLGRTLGEHVVGKASYACSFFFLRKNAVNLDDSSIIA